MAAARPVSICSIKNQVLIMLLFYLDEFMNHFFYIQVLQLYGATSSLPSGICKHGEDRFPKKHQ
jgi:hypothetical protein